MVGKKSKQDLNTTDSGLKDKLKEAELEAVEQSERYRKLFESSQDAIMTLEPPTWSFTSGNPSTVKMFTCKDEKDFVSRGPWQYSPLKQPDGQPSLKKAKVMIMKAMKEGVNFFEWTHRRLTGEDFPATVLLTRMTVGDKTFLQATVRDITRQKEAEEALKERLQYERLISQISKDMIAHGYTKRNLDSILARLGKAIGVSRVYIFENSKDNTRTSNTYEWCAKGVSPEIENLQNMSYDDIRYWRQVLSKNKKIVSSNIREFPEQMYNLLKVQGIKSIVCVPLFVGKEWYGFMGFDDCERSRDWNSENVSVLGVVAEMVASALRDKRVHEDLEERVKERTYALAEEKAKTDSLIASVGEGILAVDLQGHVLLMNPAAKMLLGKVKMGTHMLLLGLVNEKRKKLRTSNLPFSRVIEEMGQVRATLYASKGNGKEVPLATTLSPFIQDGKLLGVIANMRDITREMEIDRAKSEFISLTSHQLRTPLTGIKWLVQAVLSRAGLNEWQRELLEDAIKSNERMIHLVNELLNISRLEAGAITLAPVRVDFLSFIADLIGEFGPEAHLRGQTIEYIRPSEKIMVTLDKALISQVVINVLSNAIKYNRPKKPIVVTVKQRGDEVDISVSDQGIGLSKEDKQKLFSKFFRSDRASKLDTKGSGLGLYIVKKILDAHDGKIQVQSRALKGTTFTVILPVKGPSSVRKGRDFIVHRTS